MINKSPRQWGNILVLSATLAVILDWIPAYAGMTTQWVIWDKLKWKDGTNEPDRPHRTDTR